ncbi:MAG: HAMP domain-containing histidine kinase [Atopobiaceae bacterium]|nr:HAMP domain-containing histidine kinase [Atopobiaceae bacterium]
MIKALRIKFITVGMLSVFIMLAALMVAIDAFNYYSLCVRADDRIDFLVNASDLNEGGRYLGMGDWLGSSQPFIEGEEEFAFETRFFTVTLSSLGVVEVYGMNYIAAVDQNQARQMASELYAKGADRGFLGNYRYGAVPLNRADGTRSTMYVFLDCGRDLSAFYLLVRTTAIIALIGMGVAFFLIVMFSDNAVRPMAESYEKQRRFITDASHDLKTPLAVINSSVDVIEIESGKTEWTQGIKHQVSRLTDLTNKLVVLAKMEEVNPSMWMQDFDMAELALKLAEEFMAIAVAQGKVLDIDIVPQLDFHGDPVLVEQVMTLLLDNALKYSSEHGRIQFTLEQPNPKQAVIKTANPVDSIKAGEHNELFERFFRSDESRSSETGGHGIGLAVVKAVAEAHHGSATAYSKDDHSIEFVIKLGDMS